MSLWIRTIAILGALAVPLFLVGEALDLYVLRIVVKPWPVLALLAWTANFGRQPYARRIAIGLGFSALGDLLLEISDATFLPGVGAFLLAHVAYIAAFLGEESRPRWALALPFTAWGVLVVGFLQDGLSAADMLLPVGVYTTVICTMLWRATACRVAGTLHSALALTGAVLFATSDTLIAVSRFSEIGIPNVSYAIILLYWAGQAAIAVSARSG